MGLVISRSWTAAAVVFVVAASTDWFDGRLARRWNVSSRLGSFLDTTADKLLVTGVLVALVAVGRASPWVSMVIIGRELSLLGLRAAVATQGLHLEPSKLGKWKATTQFAALTLVMLRPDVVIAGAFLDQWLLALAALVSVLVRHRLLRSLLLSLPRRGLRSSRRNNRAAASTMPPAPRQLASPARRARRSAAVHSRSPEPSRSAEDYSAHHTRDERHTRRLGCAHDGGQAPTRPGPLAGRSIEATRSP